MNKFKISDDLFTLTLDRQEILECRITKLPSSNVDIYYRVYCPMSSLLSIFRKENELYKTFEEANKNRNFNFKTGNLVYFVHKNKVYSGVIIENKNGTCIIKNNIDKYTVDVLKVFYTEYEAKIYIKYNKKEVL